MGISGFFSALILILLASATGFGQPPGPPPHDMEPPEGVPPSLLELAEEMSAVRGSLAETRQDLYEAVQDDSGGGFAGGNHPWHPWGGKPSQMRQNHETIQKIQDLRGEAGRISREAWETVREIAEARKESAAPPPPPERRKELERWMMSTFGPPPRERDPFPWKRKHMGNGHPGFPNFEGKMFFEKIDRMEKRIEQLEETVRAQEEQIRELRDALEGKESPSGQRD